jgi:hypothetical protein
MGWKNSHLHDFSVGEGELRFGPGGLKSSAFGDDLEKDSRIVSLGELFKSDHKEVIYTYDFDDGWEHSLTLVKKVEKTQGLKYPHCVDGSGACPPEDCGGAFGYMDLRKVLSNPKKKEYKDAKKWVGRGFNQCP